MKENSLKIDERLKEIANFLPSNITVADIGTDHGYLPIYLIQNNIATHCFACDVRALPLESAKKNISYYNLDNKIETILTDGLVNVPNVDYVIMAGMGGYLINRIIKDSNYKFNNFILEPNQNVDLVRKFLSENNYQIIDEKVTKVHNKYYEIIKVSKGIKLLNEKEIKYGPINLIKKEPLFLEKWEGILKTYLNIIATFNGSDNERKRIELEIKDIQEALKKEG